jgi:hypothetical protein
MLKVDYKESIPRCSMREMFMHTMSADDAAPICRRRESHRLRKLFLHSPTVSFELVRSCDGQIPIFDAKFLRDLDGYFSKHPDDGMIILDFLGQGPVQNLENFPGTLTIPYLLSRLPDSFAIVANLTEICGFVFRTNLLRKQPITFLRQFLSEFSLPVARILLALTPLCLEQTDVLFALCSQLVATCEILTTQLTFRILVELPFSRPVAELVMAVLAQIEDERLLAAGLKVLSNAADSCELDVFVDPLFNAIGRFISTGHDELQESICEFLETMIENAFDWIFESTTVEFVLQWIDGDCPFQVKQRAIMLLCELVQSCPGAQVPHLLEFPVVECLMLFLTVDTSALREVLQALEVIVDRTDDLSNVIPAIADCGSVLEDLAAYDNDVEIVEGATHLLPLLGHDD